MGYWDKPVLTDDERLEREHVVARELKVRDEEVILNDRCAECGGMSFHVPLRVRFSELHNFHRPDCETGKRGVVVEDPGRCSRCLGRHNGGCSWDPDVQQMSKI